MNNENSQFQQRDRSPNVPSDVVSKPPVPEQIESKWQGLIDTLAEVVDVRVGLIMRVVDADIEVFLASKTTGNPYHPGEREKLIGSGLYCETVLRERAGLLVPDAPADERWKNNPDLKLGMVSYLGFPISVAGWQRVWNDLRAGP